MNFDDAQAHCKTLGGSLLIANSSEEHDLGIEAIFWNLNDRIYTYAQYVTNRLYESMANLTMKFLLCPHVTSSIMLTSQSVLRCYTGLQIYEDLFCSNHTKQTNNIKSIHVSTGLCYCLVIFY